MPLVMAIAAAAVLADAPAIIDGEFVDVTGQHQIEGPMSAAPTSDLTIFAGCFVKLWHIPRAETVLEQHRHAWDHISLVTQGRVRVFCGGTSLGEFVAPAVVKIAADQSHHFVSLTDDVCIACIHAVGNAEED